MTQRTDSWRDTVRAVGEALVDVLRAEAAVVGETWKRSGRELGKIVALVVVLAYLALICLPTLLIFALFVGLSAGLNWPLWAAALTVTGLVTVVAGLLVWLVQHRITHRLESPAATVRQRFVDHRAWWNERIVGGEAASDETASDETASDETASDETASDETASERTATEGSGAQGSVTQRPVTQRPVTQRPVTRKPVARDSVPQGGSDESLDTSD